MHEDNTYLVYESAMARLERTNKRLCTLCLIILLALMGTNIAWVVYENQFEDVVTVTQDADVDGNSDLAISGTGDITYGDKGTSDSHYREKIKGRR
jgi:hypothetical protein